MNRNESKWMLLQSEIFKFSITRTKIYYGFGRFILGFCWSERITYQIFSNDKNDSSHNICRLPAVTKTILNFTDVWCQRKQRFTIHFEQLWTTRMLHFCENCVQSVFCCLIQRRLLQYHSYVIASLQTDFDYIILFQNSIFRLLSIKKLTTFFVFRE